MNITVEKLPNCTASLRIELPGETRKAERDRVVKNYVQHAALPGFRKGKAPRNVVEKKFAQEIDREVTDAIVQNGIKEAAKKENLRVLTVTDFKPDDDNSETKYAFSLRVILAPEIELPDYKGLGITVPKREVTDEMVENVIQRQREQMANLLPVERAVRSGDFITIAYSASKEGESLKEQLPDAEGFIAENSEYMLKVDDGSFLPGFCAQLTGMSKGETREVKVTMPEEGINELIAGKEVVYQVTVAEVKEAELAELNDEFADKVFKGKTMEELRGLVRENVGAQEQQKDLEAKRIAAMVVLREKLNFDLPPNVVHSATQNRVNQLVRMNIERGVTQGIIQENQDDIINAAKEQAQVDVKDEYILMEIVGKENLAVTQEDMVRRVQYIAVQNSTTPDKVVKSLQKGDGLDSLRHSILLGKALDVLVEHANVTYEGSAGPEGTFAQS